MQRAFKKWKLLKECVFAHSDMFVESQYFILDQRFPSMCDITPVSRGSEWCFVGVTGDWE